MTEEIYIAAAGNTEVPAYLCLKEKGYKMTVRDMSKTEQLWTATKGNVKLSGNGPLELLALAAILSMKGKNWKATDGEIEAFTSEYC